MSSFNSMTCDQINFDSEEKDSFSMQQCPVAEQADNALKSSVETRQAIRRLRQTENKKSAGNDPALLI